MITKAIITNANDDNTWFTIEYAEHAHESGLRHIPEWGCMGFWHSGRISDADVEGDADEIAALAKAVLADGEESFNRCAVEVNKDEGYAEFSSPRNSQRPAKVRLDIAKAWATETLKKLGSP